MRAIEIVFAYLNTQFGITKSRVLTHGAPELSSGEQGMIVADRLENRAILGRAICCVKREPSAPALSNVADPRSKTRAAGRQEAKRTGTIGIAIPC